MIAPVTKNGRRPDCLVMVDAENFGASLLDKLMAELPRLCKRMTLQAYGVSASHRSLYESCGFAICEKLKIANRSKNLVDMQLTIEAIEIGLKYRSVKTFVIVSGDGDFIPLAKKLSELGKKVISITGPVPRNADLLRHVHAALTIKDENANQKKEAKSAPKPNTAKPPTAKASSNTKSKKLARKVNPPSSGDSSQKSNTLSAEEPGKRPGKRPPATSPKKQVVVVEKKPLDSIWLDRIKSALEALLAQHKSLEVNLALLGRLLRNEYEFQPKSHGFRSWKKLVQCHAQDLNCLVVERASAVYLRSQLLFV